MHSPPQLSAVSVIIPLFFLCLSGSVQAQSPGPVRAVSWANPADGAETLTESPRNLNDINFTSQDVQEVVNKLDGLPDGMRWITPVGFSFYIVRDNYQSDRENPNDRTEATKLTEDISGENRTSIAVESLPYDLSDGHELAIQTGDPSNVPLTWDDVILVYVDGGATSGDTSISIDDGSGNPVTITASSGDRVLSDHQSPWLDHATAQMKAAMEGFMQQFVDNGGHLDGIAHDAELNVEPVEAIKHDPRFDDASEWFDGKSVKEVINDAGYTMDEVLASQGDPNKAWDALIGKRALAEGLNESTFQPAKEYFPDLKGSNYGNTGVEKQTAEDVRPNQDGQAQWHKYLFGTHGSMPLYSSIRSARTGFKFLGGSIPFKYNDDPFSVVRWTAQVARGIHRDTGGKFQPWITYENLNDFFFQVDTKDTPYYEEYLRQTALHVDSGAPLLFFNARGAGGGGGSDENDLEVDAIFQEINAKLDNESFSTVTTGLIEWDSDLIVTAVETSEKRLYRVAVRRVQTKPTVGDITVSVSNGDSITVPQGEVGFWYETSVGNTLTFTHDGIPAKDNVLPDDTWLDWNSDNYTFVNSGEDGAFLEGGVGDPDGGTDAYRFSGRIESNTIPVDANQLYTFTVWLKTVGANSEFEIHRADDTGRLVRIVPGTADGSYQKAWQRARLIFRAPSDGTDIMIKQKALTGIVKQHVYRPMLHKGEGMAPFQGPDDALGTSQTLSLRQGGNLVSSVVQPADPDLETVLGSAVTSITQIKTEGGQVFDPDTGTDEIGTWEAGKPYNVYAKASTSFDVQGTVLDSASVSLDDGWNWLPYPDSTSVAIDQALEPIQNDLVMVKDETGRVYRPAQSTNQIQSLEPGTAYKILLENPVTLSYPLE